MGSNNIAVLYDFFSGKTSCTKNCTNAIKLVLCYIFFRMSMVVVVVMVMEC